MASRSAQEKEKPEEGRVNRVLLLVFIALSTLVLAGGYLFLRHQSRSYRRTVEDDLVSIAKVKAQSIATWYRERVKDAQIITQSPFFTENAIRMMKSPGDERLRAEVTRWLASRLDPDNYRSICLLDPECNQLISYPETPEPLGPDSLKILEAAFSRGEPVVSDLLYQYTVQGIHMDIVAPILEEGGRPLGAVLLRVDPYRTLYPLLQSWPIQSETAETILLRQENGTAVYLNELRHRSGTAIHLRSGPGSGDELAQTAISGYRGTVEAIDYRGKKVLAHIEEIPGTGWIMAAKVDESELLAPLNFRNYLMLSLLLLLLLFIALLIMALRVRHQRELYKTKYAYEAERRALTKHFEYLTKYANDIILLVDGDGKIVEANERAVETYGYPREVLLGMNIEQIREESAEPVLGKELLDFASEGVLYETVHRRSDGSVFPVEVSARSIQVEDRVYLQAIVRDITERKRFQRNLERINQCFLGMGEDALGNMARITMTARELMNAVEANYTRFDGGNVQIFSTSRPDGFFRLDQDLNSVWKTMTEKASLSPGGVAELSEVLRAFPGCGLLLANPSSYYGASTRHGRELKGLLGVAFDHPRALSRDEVEVLRILSRALSVEEERLAHEEELRDFIDIASHELRHPMTIIKGYADLLRVHHPEMSERERAEIFQALGDGVERMDSLVYELLEAARIDRRGLVLHREETDISQLIQAVAVEMRGRAPSVTLSVDLPPGLPTITADRERLRQVLVILLDNALKFSPEGSEVGISAEVAGRELLVRVADRGPGVPEELRERIFERFFQVEDSIHHSTPGIGMGLYIAKRIMDAHGGRIWQEPREGGGSVFSFSLPLDGFPEERA